MTARDIMELAAIVAPVALVLFLIAICLPSMFNRD